MRRALSKQQAQEQLLHPLGSQHVEALQARLSMAAALSHEIFFCTITCNYTYQGGHL